MSSPRTVDVRAPAEQSEGTRSQILRWFKSAGEPVVRDEPLIELETDKVTVEIAAPVSGVLAEILKQAQEEIAPGELLGRIEAANAAAVPATAVRVSTVPAAAATPLPSSPPPAKLAPERSEAPARMSPAVRRLLAERGIDPATVRGTGADGRITVDDVLRCAERPRETPAAAAGDTGVRAQASRDAAPETAQPPAGRRIPHSPMRKRIAEHMVSSLLHTAPHVTSIFEADFSAVLAHRARHRAHFAHEGALLTLTVYILAACVEAIRAVPEANARWTDAALEIFEEINIGVATALPDRGLIVPVVRDVGRRSLREIARELARLVGLARVDRLAPSDVRGGTFTISNHGVSGSLLAAPIVINQPQTAILGVGKVEQRPVVAEEGGEEPGAGRIVARPRGFVTLTVDHRALDGHRANRFLAVLVEQLERWPPE